MTTIDKIIKVGAIFQSGKIVPKWFYHDNKKYDIREVNYQWEDFEGIEKLMFFSVSDAANSYEISFNLKRLTWKLDKISMSL
jgi:hypothetical protein